LDLNFSKELPGGVHLLGDAEVSDGILKLTQTNHHNRGAIVLV
jgi:hypothetical protein